MRSHGKELVSDSKQEGSHEFNKCLRCRLKSLKDEIKKPYFISLKKFLWEEGVRGADDTPKYVKIYPPGEL